MILSQYPIVPQDFDAIRFRPPCRNSPIQPRSTQNCPKKEWASCPIVGSTSSTVILIRKRWTPFLRQFGSLAKVDSGCLIIPPLFDDTPLGVCCHRGTSGSLVVVAIDPQAEVKTVAWIVERETAASLKTMLCQIVVSGLGWIPRRHISILEVPSPFALLEILMRSLHNCGAIRSW